MLGRKDFWRSIILTIYIYGFILQMRALKFREVMSCYWSEGELVFELRIHSGSVDSSIYSYFSPMNLQHGRVDRAAVIWVKLWEILGIP